MAYFSSGGGAGGYLSLSTGYQSGTSVGFNIVGTLPCAFKHPDHGLVDAYIMYQDLRQG